MGTGASGATGDVTGASGATGGTPTWEELLRRNRATATSAIRATVHTSGPGGLRVQHVWHAPPDLWRIEDADGNPERIVGTRWCFDRSGEVMVRTDRFAQRATGAAHAGGPEQLLVLHRDWPAEAPRTASLQAIVLDADGTGGRSATFEAPEAPEPPYRPVGTIEAAVVGGRAGWTVHCVRTASGHPITWTFDDETGVVIGRNAGGFGAIELVDVEIADHFSPAVFGFHGAFTDLAQLRRDSERGMLLDEDYRDNQGAGDGLERHLGTFVPLLVRTDFTDRSSWEAVVGVVGGRTSDGDEPDFTLIDNPDYDGWTPERFLEVIDGIPDYVLLADATTMTHPDLPVLFLSTADPAATWAGRGARVRVAARSVAAVDAALSLGDRTVADIAAAAGRDGVYR
ncbi:hypothetical protein GII33_17525 [Gordonia pseudamarae]|jgi:hypothetical protein|uniref:DUF6924 domain-containing protein n=1 Tax=Gordonia TaxID=2053 RepID=UPI0019B39502|nr:MULTISPECIES: hypothetical protein [Gordonia]MBD0021117.1 hypothetical protein [Gordonia sp. (in: high G+C Gram-positive bacteria)]QHN27489.1 hypothetical protein GII33_17525 [Gordonia pseudamarae]